MSAQRRPGRLPNIAAVDGQPVRWTSWALMPANLRTTRCQRCRHRGAHWATYARVDPAPGESWTIDGHRVQARPTLRLAGYVCPGCGDRRVVDLADTGRVMVEAAPATPEQLALFGADGS